MIDPSDSARRDLRPAPGSSSSPSDPIRANSDSRGLVHPHAAPIVKWCGGKTKLLPQITARMPSTFRRYHEPFMGGAAVFFALASSGRLTHGAVLSDVNPDLVNLYRALAWNVIPVADELRKHELAHRRAPADTFERIRRVRNKKLARRVAEMTRNDTFELTVESKRWAASTLYLNRTCYNGLWRVNRHGAFNAPLGAYKHATLEIVRREQLMAAGVALGMENRGIHCRDFAAALADVEPGDFVYVDPPYLPMSASANFTTYAAGGFGLDRQRELAATLNTLARRGVHVIASNADTPLAREIYAPLAWLELERVEMPRNINSSGGKRGNVAELLITSRKA